MTWEIVEKFEHIPEILAPAGGPAQFFAALNSGADAVFLGLKVFNARARAANFTIEELRSLMPLARSHGMKVLVTLNILIKEAELPQLLETLNDLADIAVDAIIVQDLAVARLAKRHFPTLRLHASTQMAVHNLAGVMQAMEWGFKRVVIAREITATELRQIRAALPRDQIEIEAFSHGSLCYSYSGLCFFSGAADARSGNRGECAYTCRQPYKVLNEEGHGFLFSMRDLDTADDLEKFISAGIDTLKIEGRKKDAQYVSSVVQHYRKRLDQLAGRSTLRLDAPAEAHALYGTSLTNASKSVQSTNPGSTRSDLELSFQRRGTSFFLNGRYHENVIDLDNPTHLGVRVGVIEAVNRGPSRVTIKVRAETNLERFDGLRVVKPERVHHSQPQHGKTDGGVGKESEEKTRSLQQRLQQRYDGEDLEFSLRDMTVFSERVAIAKSGSIVTVTLPEGREKDTAGVRAGDLLYKVRSADLKRRVEALSVPPAGARVRPLMPVEVSVTVTASDAVHVLVSVSSFGQEMASAEAVVPALPARTPRFTEDCREVFSVFGEEGFEASSITVSPTTWFVPNKILKQLKRDLAPQLAAGHQRFSSSRLQSALADLRGQTQKLSHPMRENGISVPRYAVKIDRLEYLDVLADFLGDCPDFKLTEVVFEPKRAFLGSRKPAEISGALRVFREKTGVGIRFAIPTVVRAWDEPLLEVYLKAAVVAGICGFEVGNPGALHQVREWARRGLVDFAVAGDVTTDFTAYTLNHVAAAQWADDGARLLTLSVEDDRENLLQMLQSWPAGDSRPQAILYKDTPLFVAEACSLTALHGGCPGADACGYRTLHIENTKGERFYAAHEGCKSIVYGEDAYGISQNLDDLVLAGVENFRIDFLTRPYTPQRIIEVLSSVQKKTAISATHSANFSGRLL